MCTTTLSMFSRKMFTPSTTYTQTLPRDKLGFSFISHIDAAAVQRKRGDRKREEAGKYRICNGFLQKTIVVYLYVVVGVVAIFRGLPIYLQLSTSLFTLFFDSWSSF